MKVHSLIVLCWIVMITGCSSESTHYHNQFVKERETNNWTLTDDVLGQRNPWDVEIQDLFVSKSCSEALTHYFLYSSDVISHAHSIDLSNKLLTDDCLAVSLLFVRDVLGKNVEKKHELNYKIDLSNNPLITDRSMAYLIDLIKIMPEIKRLDLRGNYQISLDAMATARYETHVDILGSL